MVSNFQKIKCFVLTLDDDDFSKPDDLDCMVWLDPADGPHFRADKSPDETLVRQAVIEREFFQLHDTQKNQ